MSSHKIQVGIKYTNGTIAQYHTEVNLPDYLDSKVGNSSYKEEIIQALNVCLPANLGGSDWRKKGATIVSFVNLGKP